MSWWDTSNISALAANAIKTAQKKIDKVLDIKDEDVAEREAAQSKNAPAIDNLSRATTSGVRSSPKANTSDNFWDTWLSPTQSDAGRGATLAKPAASATGADVATAAQSTRKGKGSSILLSRPSKPALPAGVAAKPSRAEADESGSAAGPQQVEEERASLIADAAPSAVQGDFSVLTALQEGSSDKGSSVFGSAAVNLDAAAVSEQADDTAADRLASVARGDVHDEAERSAGVAASFEAGLAHEQHLAVSASPAPERMLSEPLPPDAGWRPTVCTLPELVLPADTSSDMPPSAEPAVCHLVTDRAEAPPPSCVDDCLSDTAAANERSRQYKQLSLKAVDMVDDAIVVPASLAPEYGSCAGTGSVGAILLSTEMTGSDVCSSSSSSSSMSSVTVAEARPKDDSKSSDAGTEQDVAACDRTAGVVAEQAAQRLLEQSFDDMVIVDHEISNVTVCSNPRSDDVSTAEAASSVSDIEQITTVVPPDSSTEQRGTDAATVLFAAAMPFSGSGTAASDAESLHDHSDNGDSRRPSATDDGHRISRAHSRNPSVDVGSSGSPAGTLSDRNCPPHDDLLDVETGTSSDIEIISMSTHSESNGDARLVDFVHGGSLARSIFKTKMRELSPEISSDSGSSGCQSSPPCVHGDDAPDSPLPIVADASHVKTFPIPAKRDAADDPLDSQTLLKKLSHLAEVLEARESKILVISRENADLNEVILHLKHKIEALEEGNVAVENLKEEFGHRLSEMERRLQAAVREKDAVKKQLAIALDELNARSGSSQAMEHMLREKDEQISSLLQEGEKLSKQQLQSNNIIKKLRTKEKENDELLKSQREKVDSQKKEIERLQAVLDSKIDNEKQHSDSIKQLNAAAKKYQEENSRLKSEADEYQEKVRSMQSALDSSYKEIAELLKASASKESRVQELALSAEMQAKEELRQALDKLQRETAREMHARAVQLEDLQLAMARAEKEHSRRESSLREEVTDLQRRLQEADARSSDLTRNVALSTRPLLRQIENLQSAHSSQSEAWEKLERNLTERLAEAQSQLAGFAERERIAADRAMEASTKVSALESQCSSLKQERLRLVAEVDVLKARVDLLEEDKSSTATHHASSRQSLEKEVVELKKEKVFLENQLEMEKVRADGEKKKCIVLQDQLKEKEQQLVQQFSASPGYRGSPAPAAATASAVVTPSRESSGLFLYKQEDVLERALQTPVLFGMNSTGSLYESMRQSGATSALIENLEAQLKCREGEVLQLQSELTEMERSREAVMAQLIQLTNANEKLQQDLQEVPRLRTACQDLDKRCNALLQMYGEKVEEVNELRMDLQDVKEMYKNQIDILVAKSQR